MSSTRVPQNLELNEFSALVAEKRKSDVRLLDLTESNPTKVRLNYPMREIRRILAEAESFPYEPDARGSFPARQAVALLPSRSNRLVRPENVWLTSGTSEAYSFLTKLLTNPGDEIAIPTPSYPLFAHLLALEGVRPVSYSLVYAEGWFIDFELLQKAIGTRTKAIVLVNPNNPTGHFVRASEMKTLLELCATRNLALIVDEVFLEFSLEEGPDHVSFARDSLPAVTFVLSGLSKWFGLPQLKLSWISLHGPEKAVREAGERLDWIADLYLSVATSIQRAFPKLAAMESVLTPMIRDRIRENHQFLKRRLESNRTIRFMPSEGGWSAILRLPDSVDEERWGMDLLRKEDVVVHPGYFFDLPFPASAVISLLPEPEQFREAMERIARLGEVE